MTAAGLILIAAFNGRNVRVRFGWLDNEDVESVESSLNPPGFFAEFPVLENAELAAFAVSRWLFHGRRTLVCSCLDKISVWGRQLADVSVTRLRKRAIRVYIMQFGGSKYG